MTERTLFDPAEDDGPGSGSLSSAPPSSDGDGLRRVEGGAPCQEGAGESPARRCGNCDELLSVGHRDGCIQEHLRDKEELASSQRPTDSLWREMPHERFMSMDERDQLDYCARRDEDSARFADNADDAAWYRDRAAWYRRRMEEI